MDNMQEKCLTLEDKAKLKERLALLKKEYRRTVNRLQKSERAERVKSHVKRTIEEQNRLLSQEHTGQDGVPLSAGPENLTSDARGKEVHEMPSTEKERKSCVSFKLEPEIVSRTPPYSGGESSGPETEGSKADQSSQTSRSRLRLKRSARKVCFSESPSPNVFRGSSFINFQDGKDRPVDKSLSPVFKKHPTDSIPLRPEHFTGVGHEIAGASGGDLLRPGTSNNSLGGKKSNYDILPSGGSQITSPKELEQYSMERISHKSEEQQLSPCISLDVETNCSPTCVPSASPSLALTLENPTNVTITPKNHPLPNRQVSNDCTLTEEGCNPLSSCTLVEGLLFPVEYYVRTTRRMTSCQSKVDLDAVINSHLGTGRKGFRGRPRRNSTSLSTPVSTGDKLSNSMTPLRHPSGGVTKSRRGKGRRSCPAVLSSGLKDVSVQLKFGGENNATPSGSQSEKENNDETLASKESDNAAKCPTNVNDGPQVKEVERFMKLLSNKPYRLRSQEAPVFNVQTSDGDKDSKLCHFMSSMEVYEPTGSPLALLCGRVSLDYLSQSLKTTDFHLPDEDFGILKLEKLKSVNNLEPLVSPAPRDCCKHPKNDSIAMLTPGSSVVRQEGNLEVCSEKTKQDFKILETDKHCCRVDLPLCQTSTLENDDLALSAKVEDAPQSNISEPSNAMLSKLSPVINNVLGFKEDICKDFPFIPSSDITNHNDTSIVLERALPDEKTQQNTADSLKDGKEQTYIPFTGELEAAENLEADLDSHKIKDSIDDPTAPKSPGKFSSSTELNSSVLFSTSLCSVPIESMNDVVAFPCTAGLPFLGSTPAICPLTHTNNIVTLSPAYQGQEEVLHPEVYAKEPTLISLSGLGATGGTEDTKQCNDVLEQDNVVENHSEYQEDLQMSKETCITVISERPNNEEPEVGTVLGSRLHLLSELKDSCRGGCVVDLCPVWWTFSESTELCIVSASESSVCLWRPQADRTWECAHIWSFTEMPVIQILPLSQDENIVCVALGNLEIMEIWALFSSPERPAWKKQLVKFGHIETAQGLSRHRLVSSSSKGDGQVVEVQELSEIASTVESISLVSPKDNVLAFCEVEGEKDALVGSTTDTYLVVWNAVTGHLLSTICVGDHCSDLTCLSATSDSGLLFLVVGTLFSKPCEDAGSSIFNLIAANPQGGASISIMSYIIPDKPSSRFLEGEVKRQKAAAVLTCGSIALWDLSRSHCSVSLPPSLEAPWCLVRWSHIPSCLLIGSKDGTICMYEYMEGCSDKER